MAAPMIALTLVNAGLSAYSAIEQGNYESQAYTRSAEINDINAQTAAIETAHNENIARRQLRQQLSAQLAAQGEAGISGSSFANLSMLQSAGSGESDVLNIRLKGLAEAENYRNKAALDRFSATNARSSSKLSAITELFGGAASALSMGYDAGYFKKKVTNYDDTETTNNS